MQDMLVIDGLQYSNWSEALFRQMREGGLSAVHATIAYHETARETLSRIGEWNRRFEAWPADPPRAAGVGHYAGATGGAGRRILRLPELLAHRGRYRPGRGVSPAGVFVMQLTYNNQSLLASGCYESEDNGISRFGRQVIGEMNRVGMLIDMSHSAERSTLQAIELSARPVIISTPTPAASILPGATSPMPCCARSRNPGLLGFSTYPFHLRGGPACRLDGSATWWRARRT